MDIASPFKPLQSRLRSRSLRSFGHFLILSSEELVAREVSESIHELLGISAEELCGSSLDEWLESSSLELLRNCLEEILGEPSFGPLLLECEFQEGPRLDGLLSLREDGCFCLELAVREECVSLALWPLKAERRCRELR